ncbi:MAG: phosphatidate cytidylyltransferase [Clostridia bacterium]|nr:phosphatidate cytidylyltransferase [Clostridia bacterium]
MSTRIITGVLGTLLLIAVLALGTPFFEIAVCILAVLAVYELFRTVNLTGNKIIFVSGIVASAVFITVQTFFNQLLYPLIFMYIAILFIIYMKFRSFTELKDIAESFFLIAYAVFFFSHLNLIYSSKNGNLLIWMVFICAFATDTFAMFGGKFFGKHKLCPVLSPKKTVEGSISGILGCILCVLIYCYICKAFFYLVPNYLNAVIVSLFASVISQIGDLSASCIKRQYGIKDYGNLFPGHGGVMDRFDSILFTAPFVYYIMIILPIIN